MSETTTESTTETAGETSADTSSQAETATAEATATTEATEALGDAGKKALDAMKAERKAARDAAATEKARADALQAKLDGKEAEFTAAQEAQRVRDEALEAANQRILKAEIRAAAAGKLNDPADALAYIDLSLFEVGDDGSVDSDAIGSAVSDLISKKPYLAAQGQRFQGSADGGARNEAGGTQQLTRADMARMTPQQIDEATREGKFADLLSGKQN
jgi:hypothetical protein